MTKKIIEVKNLIKKYGDFAAVDNISFEVFEGEIFGLLGPNGAGKTTTLEIIETLREKTSGEVLVDGFSVDGQGEEIKKIIGIQLQQSGFYPGLNLIEILQLFEGIYGTKAEPLELLKLVDLQDKSKSQFNKMSGGQKQRFSIATTLINKPKIIFLDEPTTGLDPQARRNLWDLIRKIQSEGATIVITTHYMDEAEILCDRVAIVEKGKIVAIDTPDNLIDNLISKGFKRQRSIKEATLEDVFLDLTGRSIEETQNI